MDLEAITTLLTATGGAFLSKFIGPAAEHLGKLALERAQQLSSRASDQLAAVGREPQPVELKVLMPLVQVASVETNEALSEKWAALLANAADPSAKAEVTVSFVDILRQLGVGEVKIIQHLDAKSQDDALKFSLSFNSLASEIGMTEEVFEVTVDNLLRLQLCELPSDEFEINNNGDLLRHIAGKDKIALTALCKAFLKACTPPTL